MTAGALSHIRVLDLTSHISGPYCTKLLADYGAEVIKIERPGTGDATRRMGPFPSDEPDPEASGRYVYLNSNKKSVTLNLRSSSGRAILHRLLDASHLTVISLTPAAMDRIGIDPVSLAKDHPGLASVSITNFGLSGPYRDYKADHMTLCAMGGWAQYLGRKELPPLQAGLDLILQVSGLRAASTAIGVYGQSQWTGQAHHADVSIFETVTEMLPASPLRYAMTDVIETRGMYPFPSQGILKCSDGYVGVNTLTEDHWELMCQWMGMQDLLEDPRFSQATGRWEHTQYLRDRAETYFSAKTKDELFHEGQGFRVATGLVSNADDILGSEQLRERGYLVETKHPRMGKAVQPGAPMRMTASPWELRSPAPSLGQHNHEVLRGGLGLSKEELMKLREQGAI